MAGFGVFMPSHYRAAGSATWGRMQCNTSGALYRIASPSSHQQDIVVDGLRDANDAGDDPLLLALLLDSVGARIAAIAAHHEHHVDAPHVDLLHDGAAVQCSSSQGL